LGLASVSAAWAVSNFTPQQRVGYTTGDQWEPAMAADGHGHIYILFPQYGAVNDCPACTAPTMALTVSNDNGLTWQPPHALVASSTGQFDPQIVVDPVDRQTVYASWLQNDKRDVMVARSQDFGRSWYLTVADHARSNNNEDADKPVLAVHGAEIYVGFNHEQKVVVAASHDYGQNFSSVTVNPAADPGWSLAGGATVGPGGDVYFSWTAYARRDLSTHPVSIYVSRSGDGGRSWNTVLLDVSSAPPECKAQGCEAGSWAPRLPWRPTRRGRFTLCGMRVTPMAAPSAFTFLLPPAAGRVGRRKRMFRPPMIRRSMAFRRLPRARPET
jgi:hypothetical protein